MTEPSAPQFNRPQRPTPASGGSGAARLACVLLVVVLVLQAYALFRAPVTAVVDSATQESRESVDDLRAIAMKLEDRNLPAAAAAAWKRHLASSSLGAMDRAKILYRVGKLEYQSEQYQQAVASLYLAERLVGDGDADLTHKITMQVRECLQKMGRYSELTREMAARAEPHPDADSGLADRQVVAQIGAERITIVDFERMLQAQVDAAVAARAGLSPEQAGEFRKQTLKQLADPQARAQFLHQMVASRVLASEAKSAKLNESADYRQRLMAFADDLLASTLMTEELGKRATVTPEDAERFFQANSERYAEPARAMLAHILLESEGDAREMLARAQGEEDFAGLAGEFSHDQRTKAQGGRIHQPAMREHPEIPGIGQNAELQGAIWAVEPGTVLGEVYESAEGWHVVKVLERTERVEKTYDQVADRVQQEARAARRQEVTRQYLEELFEQHEVKLYPEAFLPESKVRGSES
ncbi:MAG: hypothetical protein GY842_21145 [bacterium]|nr:hypothetical protein [bacterium]